MKKLRMKILAPALSTLVAAATVIPTAVVFTKVNKTNVNKVNAPLTVNESLFKLRDGRLEGFKSNVTQNQIDAYIRQNGNKLVLPACKTIGANAFKNIKVPFDTSIEIDVSTTTIEEYAFFGCTAEQIQFKNGTATVTVKDSKLETIGDSAFAFCSSLKVLPVPKTLANVGASAFYNCSNLRELDFSHFTRREGSKDVADLESIDEAMGTIGDYAFAGTYLPPDPEHPENSLIRIHVAKELPSGLTSNSFALRTKLSNLAGRIGATVDPAWYEGGKDWIIGYDGETGFGIDIAIPQEYLDIQSGVIKGIKTESKVLLSNAPYNALVVGSEIKAIESGLWEDAGQYIRDLDMSQAIQMVGLNDSFVPMNPETGDSFGSRLENVYLPNTIQTIGARAFYRAKNLDWINLNDCLITAIDDYAFSGTSVRCFDSNPLGKPTQPEFDHEVSMLYINTTKLLRIGIGAFYNSGIEGIKFFGDGLTTFGSTTGSEGGVFAGTKIWKLDLSDMAYNISVDETQPANKQLLISSTSTISQLFKNLFFPNDTGPAETFTGAFSNLIKKSPADETILNEIVTPQVNIVNGTLPTAIDKTLWFQSFAAIEELAEEYTVVDQWKATEKYAPYNAFSFLDGLGTMSGNKAQLANWTLKNPAEQYKFSTNVIDPEIEAQQIQGVYPTDSVDFTFQYHLTDESKGLIPDLEYSIVTIAGTRVEPADMQDFIVDPALKTITIPADQVTGDVVVGLRSTQLSTQKLTQGTLKNVAITDLPDIGNVGEYTITFTVNEGYEYDPAQTSITTSGGSPIDCWRYEEGENNQHYIIVNGAKFGNVVDGIINIGANVIKLTPKAAVDDHFNPGQLPKDDIDWTTGDWSFTFALKEEGYEVDKLQSVVADAAGNAIPYEATTSELNVTLTISAEDLQKATNVGKSIEITLFAKEEEEEVTYNFYDSTHDEPSIQAVNEPSEIIKGKEVVFTVTLTGNDKEIDYDASYISINGVNILKNAEAVKHEKANTTVTFTITGTYVLGDIFTNFISKI